MNNNRELSSALSRLRSAQQQNEITKRGANDMGATKTRINGEIRVNTAGESITQVVFPVRFTEKPIMTFGGEVIEGDALQAGYMPTISVVVVGWITEEVPPVSRLYTGAKLGIVLDGVNHQKAIVHWSLEGTALSNPV